MTAEQLAARLGVTQPTVQKLERSEQLGTIQLNTLRRVAEALDCEVVYALAPRRPLQAAYDQRAREVARGVLGDVRHTMALEAQGVDDAEWEERLRLFIETELDPRTLWSPRA